MKPKFFVMELSWAFMIKMHEMSDLSYGKAEVAKERVNIMSGTKTANVNEIGIYTQKRNSYGHVDEKHNNNNGKRHNSNCIFCLRKKVRPTMHTLFYGIALKSMT